MKKILGRFPLKILALLSIIIIAMALLIGARPGTFGPQKKRGMLKRYVEGEVLVKFKEGVPAMSQARKAGAFGGRTLKRIGRRGEIMHIRLRDAQRVEDAVAEYMQDPDVEFAQPNYLYRAMITMPDDPEYEHLWGLKNGGQEITPSSYQTNNPGTNGCDMDLEQVWDQIHDCSSIVVAVVDTGINYDHVDLVANMWDGSTVGHPNHGYDYESNDDDPMDLNGHGTHVAGTIGAVGDNGTGTVGVCWAVKLMAVRVLDAAGSGTTVNVANGINFAVDHGARIINLSLSGPSKDQTLYNALSYAKDHDVLAVVVAGNESENNDQVVSYPCNFNLDNIICVAALDQSYNLADFSNYGKKSVDVGAPGTNIMSEWAGAVDEITDDFNSGGVLDWRRNDTNWDYNWLGLHTLTNPYNFNYSNKYSTYLYSSVYKSFTMNGNEDSMVLDFWAWVETEYRYDTFGIYKSSVIADPCSSGSPVDILTGSTLGDYYPFSYDLSLAKKATCSIGFLLRSDSSITRRGISIAELKIKTLTLNTITYDTVDGTSMAVPHVSGLAALLLAYNPSYTYKDAAAAIKYGGDAISSLEGKTTTGKAVDAWGSLCFINPPEDVSLEAE